MVELLADILKAGAVLLTLGAAWFAYDRVRKSSTARRHREQSNSVTIPTPQGPLEGDVSPDGVRSEIALGQPQAKQGTRARVQGDPATRTVFFGTDREVTNHNPVRVGTVSTGVLRLGRAQVTIPPNHRIGSLESPLKFGPIHQPYDPMRHIALNYVHLLEESAFLREIGNEFDQSRSAFIFIHGFATLFDDAARRTAQLHYDLKFPGPPILFSWASAGELDAILYNRDAESSLVSARILREFLEFIATKSGASTLHVVAHSMGNRSLLEALRDWAPSAPLLRQIILVAPDVNKRLFIQLADGLRRTGHRSTLYGSSRDVALRASRAWAGSEERAGDAHPPVIVPGVETIDVSDMDIPNDLLNHFVLDDDRVLGDMKELIDADLPAVRRLRLEPVDTDDGVYWRMKKA